MSGAVNGDRAAADGTEEKLEIFCRGEEK